MDFLGIGDVVSDTFIILQDAQVSCDINQEHCTISMRFGDKIPYQESVTVHGVGNSANASVAAARLGLGSALYCHVGSDQLGADCVEALKNNRVSTELVTIDADKKTNQHYVLQYGPERTILIKHEAYHYGDLNPATVPAWIYLSSISRESAPFHDTIVSYLKSHPETRLAFQPGTFQMELGTDTLRGIYAATELFFCNKQEAQRILKTDSEDWATLHAGIRALGPKLVVITDGVNGLTASDETGAGYHLPMYPDPKPPIDRTGAGDACSSTIVAAMQLELPFLEALRWGPINSMSVVQYIGAQQGLLSREQLEHYLADAPAHYHLTPLFSL